MAPKAKSSVAPVTVKPIEGRKNRFRIVGRTPLICNRMSEKARQVLLVGGGPKKTKGSGSLKHDPYAEFRSAMEVRPGLYPDTDIVFPAVAFKNAMATAAIYADEVNKTDIKRLVFIPDEWVPIYGVPRMRLDIMRQSGVSRTPDVRTRAVIREWETEFDADYRHPLSAMALVTLMSNAGIICGIGDSRQELGKGSFGTFAVAKGTTPKALRDVAAQREAIRNPRPHKDDAQANELLEWFRDEVQARR